MEENSEAQIETDVASAKDALDLEEVTGPDGQMQTIIYVEELKEEDTVPEPVNKQEQPEGVVTTPVKEAPVTEEPEKSAQAPSSVQYIQSPKNPPQSCLSTTKPAENQMLPQKDTPMLRTYTRTKDTSKGVQKLPGKPEESIDRQPLKKIVDSSKETQEETPEKEPPEVENSSKSSESDTVPDNATNSKMLHGNPLLANALFGKHPKIPHTEDEQDEQKQEEQKLEESTRPSTITNSPIETMSEKSSDSALETNLDVIEVHNKSISRELKSLINYAKESKIINECTQLTSKTRKSRTALDTSSSMLIGIDSDQPIGSRRSSDNSLMSNSSERSDKPGMKRSMRSQNPEFVNKVKLFLNSVTGKVSKTNPEVLSDEEAEDKRLKDGSTTQAGSPKRKKPTDTDASLTKDGKSPSDPYCWRCHWTVEQEASEKQHPRMLCTVCPRSFHYRCLSGTERSKIISEKNWVCPECLIVLHAESSETRSPAMKKISLGCLCDLLKHALERMKDLNGVEPFLHPVDRDAFPDYQNYVVHPMDLELMGNNIAEGLYGSTEAFLADAQWILHNSIIFNTLQSKLTAVARALVRSCKAEMGEIEACPECYAAAHNRRATWFTEVCSTPHLLLWAKLKGFPYWPAKFMSVSSAGLVDVRFFGAHDRAWVPARDCFLYCEKDPNNFRTKRQDILYSMQEAEQHVHNITKKYGKFVYPPFKTPLDPSNMNEQIKLMIPSFEGELKPPVKGKTSPKAVNNKRRSNSKSSKSSSNEGDISDSEDTRLEPRKMADGVEIAMEEEFTITKDKTIETNEKLKENENSRKRRRSELEEAVITIIESNSDGKRKCTETDISSSEKFLSEEPTTEINDEKVTEETPENVPNVLVYKNTPMVPTLTPVKGKSWLKKSSTHAVEERPPIKLIFTAKKPFKTSTPKGKANSEKNISSKPRALQIKRKSINKEKADSKSKTNKRRNSKNKSINISNSQILNTEDNSKNKSNEDILTAVENTDNISTTNEIEDILTKTKENADRNESINEKSDNGEQSNNDPAIKTKTLEKTENINPKSKDHINKTNYDSDASYKESEKTKDNSGNKSNETTKTKNTKLNDSEGIVDKIIIKGISTASPKTTKDQSDDDNTSLAVIAKENTKGESVTRLPTISSVRSLSSPQTIEIGPKTTLKVSSAALEINADSNVFTPTNTDNVRNMKEAVTKLNKLRTDTDQSLVGKVGVCAFARMPSTPPTEKNTSKNNSAVEIKNEPMDIDDAERQADKITMMNAFSLRPVTTTTTSTTTSTNLRDVRINKASLNVRKTAVKVVDGKTKSKKNFQQKKGDEGRSELNSKNSMVYIPIQPPVTQAPVRLARPVTVNGNSPTISVPRPSNANNCNIAPNAATQPQTPTQAAVPATHAATSAPSTVTVVAVTSGTSAPVQAFPAVGHIPTTVHTVPLITSVNGQWTFSLQPIMSVGGLDVIENDSTAQPLVNGVGDRNTVPAPTLQSVPTTNGPAAIPTFPIPPKPILANNAGSTNTQTNMIVQSGPSMILNSQGCSTAVVNRPSENPPGEPPRLRHRPVLSPLVTNTTPGTVPPPSTAGPITAKLNQNAIKLADFFKAVLEDTIGNIDEPAAELISLKLQMEESRWRHQQEIEELKHNHELVVAEMRASFDKERVRIVNETRRAAQLDLDAAVKLAKAKQWCANCSQEAQFYCCWNTSYCDYNCQRAHWTQHYSVCTQKTQDNNTNTDTEVNTANSISRLQSPTENLPKTVAAPVVSKGPVTRVINQEPTTPKSSIIVSMVEDQSGNQTVKCVGTYKPNTSQQLPTQVAPIIINKPVNVINSDEITTSTKKVMTSGGYLIVGSPTPNSAALVSAQRRPQALQYFS